VHHNVVYFLMSDGLLIGLFFFASTHTKAVDIFKHILFLTSQKSNIKEQSARISIGRDQPEIASRFRHFFFDTTNIFRHFSSKNQSLWVEKVSMRLIYPSLDIHPVFPFQFSTSPRQRFSENSFHIKINILRKYSFF